MLIDNGAVVTLYISEDRAPLHHADYRVSIEPKRLLAYSCMEVEKGSQSPNPYKRDFRRQMSPVFFAASAGHVAMVNELLNAGADPREDVSILHAVDEPSIIAQLLAGDAKLHANSESTLLDMPNGHGDTFLGVAVQGVNVFRIKEVLSLGAEPAARKRSGLRLTPCEIAVGIGYLVDTKEFDEVLAKAEKANYGHRIPIVHNGYSC